MDKKIKAPGFVGFMISPAGRWFRAIVGVAMIIGGMRAATPDGNLFAFLGLIPLAAGVFDFCILGKIFGDTFSGAEMRERLHVQQGAPHLGRKSASFTKA